MKQYKKMMAVVLLGMTALLVFMNVWFLKQEKMKIAREYQVEIERLAGQIEREGLEKTDLSSAAYVLDISKLQKMGTEEETEAFLEGNGSDYVLKKIGDSWYRFDYNADMSGYYSKVWKIMNIFWALAVLIILGILLYLYCNIIKPFDRLEKLPRELAKGNLTLEIKENENRYFGRMLWGFNMLREQLEYKKSRELELLKENKTTILALSHDIKTPLSSIKLYAKALSSQLYSEKEKQVEIGEHIGERVEEIESYMSKIIRASSEDFLHLEVKLGEAYLLDIIKEIEAYYKDKLKLLKMDFMIGKFENCLLSCDKDRLVEVLQNVIENALKYGDGRFIEIIVSEEEDCSLITVRNSGNSLKEEELSHIFDSFFRGSNSKGAQGSGLGLYISRQLMLKMDGNIFAMAAEDGCMEITIVVRHG